MALMRFGNCAVEWARVYAMQRMAADDQTRAAEQLLVYVDDPGVPAGHPVAVVTDPAQITAAWQQTGGDKRFVVFGPIAIDKAKICAVDCNTSTIRFELAQGRGVSLALSNDLLRSILDTISEPKAPPHRIKSADV